VSIDFPYPNKPDSFATVSSKGQVTLPKALRDSLGIHAGTRIRFTQTAHGGLQGEPVRYSLEDLWKMADSGPKPNRIMSLEDMDAAKARSVW